MLDIFALDNEVAQWEAELPESHGVPRLHLLARLAWHLRQRDVARAQQYAAEAVPLLFLLPEAEQNNLSARYTLVEAESRWLFGELDAAQALAEQAQREFARLEAPLGEADAHWLLAWIATDRGDSGRSDRELELAAAAARTAGDPMRVEVFEAAAALCSVFRNLHSAMVRWGGRFSEQLDGQHPVAAGWISDYLGTSAFQAADFGRAISHLMVAFEAAMATGQLRRAIIIATNIGNGFTSLNAHDAALEWMQRGLDIARPTGWPMSVGLCQMQTAETLRQLGQRDAARSLLREALETLRPVSGSRAYAVALEYQGDLALDLGDYGAALHSFRDLERRGDALDQSDFRSGARRGQAHALSMLDRPQEAQEAARAALAMASEQGDPYNQIAALRVLAEIHAAHVLPDPEPMDAPNAVLHYLQLAMSTAATIEGYIIPGVVLDAAAREYAAAGDYERAYEISLQASAARDKTHSQEATNRAIAMQVQYQTERAQTEGEHHRALAEAEAKRAEVLQQTTATLSHLSAIGQEITAHLDAAAVFRALDRHVHGLLDATHFSVFLLEPNGLYLHCAFGVEAGMTLPATRHALDDPHANSARCVRERREILIEIDGGAATPNLIPGTLPTLSLLFAPLTIGERVLGVMTVQSLLAHAYGERERMIFRTLCAYGAIALDNAAAYRQVAATLKTLSATQAQLLEKNLELERAYKALEDVSLTDQLTGLRNRRFFLQHVEADVALSLRRYDERATSASPDRDLVFFMVDMDYFKEVNDTHGHAAGDAILVQMQERLREVFRETDYLVRWGGEEFLVLARAIQREEAWAVAERVRNAVASRPFELPDGHCIDRSCSIGFACFPFLPEAPRLLNWSQVVGLADQALYVAKHSGRNGWAGLYATQATPQGDLYDHLVTDLKQAVERGEVKVVTSITQPLALNGSPRRAGLARGAA
ncbi:sensor domain-containing diguanylate cyclase [Massilia endophytica]|uniref:sensor domain-containing diguanylate cyclase n=1 Tax=Massilia endophytica TaxID=2899220 RepID=UPI001E42A21B|nr:sensor domain-containing diguanylate cyclase [Massilia endophytica]UGQ46860.1 sensor domain-containing diguanylate cyclase [Massilia endophytica]